jgi:DNA-binding response OmpR family regulator
LAAALLEVAEPATPPIYNCSLGFRRGNLFAQRQDIWQMDAPPKVLVVEDFEDLRKLVAVYLGACGYQVLEAANGKAAIQTARSGNPNLILLDIRLPDINGVDVVRELRKSSQTKHVPIVGWSAEAESNPQREMLRRAGISDYIQKPTSLKDLDAVIERFLPKPKRKH